MLKLKLSRKAVALAALLGLAGVAFAAAATVVVTDTAWTGRGFAGGIFVERPYATNHAANNAVTNVLYGTTDVDFPAIGAAGDYAGCKDSAGFTVTGAKVGDPCMVGYLAPTPYDGGATGQNFVASCSVVATGVAVIRGCCMPGDGGSCNVDDAGYTVRIISNQ
jgi:hypothetical protein